MNFPPKSESHLDSAKILSRKCNIQPSTTNYRIVALILAIFTTNLIKPNLAGVVEEVSWLADASYRPSPPSPLPVYRYQFE